MPTYEYACPTCGAFEKDQRITDPKLESCPTCGSPVKRLISRSSFALKGSGWYSDGYGSTGSGGSSGAKKADGGGCGKPQCGSGSCAGGNAAN